MRPLEIKEVKVVRAVNEDTINPLLKDGWVLLTVDTTEYYGGLGPRDVQQKYFVLGRLKDAVFSEALIDEDSLDWYRSKILNAIVQEQPTTTLRYTREECKKVLSYLIEERVPFLYEPSAHKKEQALVIIRGEDVGLHYEDMEKARSSLEPENANENEG